MQKINLIFKIMKKCLTCISNTDLYPVYEEKLTFFPKEPVVSFLCRHHLKKNSSTLTELARKNTDTDKYDKILLPCSVLVQQQYITYT